jgi:hypothetical protein
MDGVYDVVLSMIGFNIAHCDNIHLGAKARTGGMGMLNWLPWKILMTMRYHQQTLIGERGLDFFACS